MKRWNVNLSTPPPSSASPLFPLSSPPCSRPSVKRTTHLRLAQDHSLFHSPIALGSPGSTGTSLDREPAMYSHGVSSKIFKFQDSFCAEIRTPVNVTSSSSFKQAANNHDRAGFRQDISLAERRSTLLDRARGGHDLRRQDHIFLLA